MLRSGVKLNIFKFNFFFFGVKADNIEYWFNYHNFDQKRSDLHKLLKKYLIKDSLVNKDNF